ncbi:MAG: flagellar basal body rod protein FlgC [Armatimonadetes bacterium]|nr:flagellar basal body rod protein FlgC [Armatimonadota bacterium]
MNLFASMAVSATGMSAEQRRMEAAAQNIAVVHVAAKPGQESVQSRHVRVSEFNTIPDEDPTFQMLMSGNDGMRGVAAETMVTPAQHRLKYEPGHPLADENGMVSYPDISFLDEMVNMMGAQRAFDANVTAYMEARTMLQKALEIGRA